MRLYDYYATLSEQHVKPKAKTASHLVSGMVDECLVGWFEKETNGDKKETGRKQEKGPDSRTTYRSQAAELSPLALPADLILDPDWVPTIPGWFSLTVDFTLQTPWYSKDDRPFHVLDNPVRKDRVFGVPFMAASSWKGLLRWACRMKAGLLSHLEEHDNQLRGWQDPDWIVHLFGNEKGEADDFEHGALAFRPTWFDKVGFEVINPHNRQRRAGTHPILYEVVPPDTNGQLRLLYAAPPGVDAPAGTFDELSEAIEKLLTLYGISAKRTAGWGLAAVSNWALEGVGGKRAGTSTVKDALKQIDGVRFEGGR